MKKTAVILYPQFSEYELSVALSILMQGEKPVVTVGVNNAPIKGESGLTCIADRTFDTIDTEDIDSILMPGCMDIFNLEDEDKYVDFIKKAGTKDNVVASISSSPLLLAKAGILKNKKYTIGMMEQDRENAGVFEKENYVEELVVQDGNVITAWGPGFVRFGVYLGNALHINFDENWYKE